MFGYYICSIQRVLCRAPRVTCTVIVLSKFHTFSPISGRKDLAIELYKKGIDELDRGIAVDVSGNGDPSK